MQDKIQLTAAQYTQKLNEALRNPFFADRLDSLTTLKNEVRKRLEEHENEKKESASNTAGKYTLFSIATGMFLSVAFSPAGSESLMALFSLALSVVPGALAGDWLGKRSYEEKHGSDIRDLNSLKTTIERKTCEQIESLRQMPCKELAGLAKYDDLITKHPEAAQVLAKTFQESVIGPVYEQEKIARQIPPPKTSNSIDPSI